MTPTGKVDKAALRALLRRRPRLRAGAGPGRTVWSRERGPVTGRRHRSRVPVGRVRVGGL